MKSASKWSVKCSIQVEKSGICTYFMTVEFRPGGYCGIQEFYRSIKAIFSVKNHGNVDVELVEANPEAGGTVIKTELDTPWKEGTSVTFKVED